MKRALSLALVLGGLALLAPAAEAQTPTDVRAAIDRGIEARALFRYTEAWMTHYEAWVYCGEQTDPAFAELGAEAHLEMARDVFAARSFESAVREFQGAITQAQPWPKLQYAALMGLARSFYKLGQFDNAAQAAEAADALVGQTGVGPTERIGAKLAMGEARVRAAVARGSGGDLAGAKAALSGLATDFAGYDAVVAQARFQYACALVAEGMPFDAMAAFQAVVANHGDHYLAARALERLQALRALYGSEPSSFALIKEWRDGMLVIAELN